MDILTRMTLCTLNQIKNIPFTKRKLLILRLGGRISGDSLYQMSMISDKNLKKTINDYKPWFNK